MPHLIPQKCSSQKRNVARILRLCCWQFEKKTGFSRRYCGDIFFKVRIPGGKVLFCRVRLDCASYQPEMKVLKKQGQMGFTKSGRFLAVNYFAKSRSFSIKIFRNLSLITLTKRSTAAMIHVQLLHICRIPELMYKFIRFVLSRDSSCYGI